MGDEPKKCLGACYPPDVIFYNPINLHVIKNKFPSCATFPENNKMSIQCTNPSDDSKMIELFDGSISMAKNSYLFLERFYNINNFDSSNVFIKNDLINLPKYTQRRILNAIFETYRIENGFPTKEYVEAVGNLIVGDVSLNKLAKKIMKIKDDFNVTDLEGLF